MSRSILGELRVAAETRALLHSRTFRHPNETHLPGLPVMLITGVYGSDATMYPMAVWLRRMGYRPKRAGIPLNIDCSEAEMSRLELRLEHAVRIAGRRVAIVGWSRGGLFARALAVRRPDLIGGIATLGSPLLNPLRYVHPALHLALELTSTLGDRGVPHLLTHKCADEWTLEGNEEVPAISQPLLARARRLLAAGDGKSCCERFWGDVRGPFPEQVRFVSFYSRSDGIVHWHSCLDPAARQVEVRASHLGLAVCKELYPKLAFELERISLSEPEAAEGRTASTGGGELTLAA